MWTVPARSAKGAKGSKGAESIESEAEVKAATPPYPPMVPGGGYDVRLLCPPNALYIAHSRAVMLAAGAVQARPCWDLSAADVPPGLFSNMNPPEAATFEMANTTSLANTFYGDSNIPVALTGLGNVVSTYRMFENNYFNSPIALEGLGSTGKWTDAAGIFANAGSFNQPIDAIGDWSAVTEMWGLFANAGSFNQPVTALYTASPTDVSSMFYVARSFNQPIGGLDTSKATTFSNMFLNAHEFNQPIGQWTTSRVTTTRGMFSDARAFNQPLNDWDMSHVTDMAFMFGLANNPASGRLAFNQPLDQWNTSQATSMQKMFNANAAFAQELAGWDVRKVTSFGSMFEVLRMRSDAIAGAEAARAGTMSPAFGRACRIHHSWKAQTANWDPVNAHLVDDAANLDLSLCAPYLAGGALQGDPHLGLAHGGKADFRGCDGCLFSFLSTRDVSVNARLRAATFSLGGSEVHGTFVTEVHVVTLDRATDTLLPLLCTHILSRSGPPVCELTRATHTVHALRPAPATADLHMTMCNASHAHTKLRVEPRVQRAWCGTVANGERVVAWEQAHDAEGYEMLLVETEQRLRGWVYARNIAELR